MSYFQASLERACRELGLDIVAPFVLKVREGVEIHAQALLPQLGARKGMIIVIRGEQLRGMSRYISRMGYGYSVMYEHRPDSPFDLETWMNVFSDWGWAGHHTEKPAWMK